MSSDSFILLSDTHFHNFPMFGGSRVSETDPELSRFAGCNQRAVALLEAVERVYGYALDNDITTVFHLGDMFHTKGHVSLPVLNAATSLFRTVTKKGIRTFGIPGNHDFAGKSDQWGTLNTCYPISEVQTLQQPDLFLVETFRTAKLLVLMIPYMSSRDQILATFEQFCPRIERYLRDGRATHSALFMHTSLDGAVVGPNEYVMREGLKPADVPFEFFNLVASGHYHLHQTIPYKDYQFVYVGAIAQHNFGERNYTPGFLHCTFTESGIEFKQIENEQSPRFHSKVVDSRKELRKLMAEMDGFPDYLHILWKGDSLPADLRQSDHCIIENVNRGGKIAPRMEVGVKDSPESLVKSYVELNSDPEHLEALVEMGLEILQS